jgi:hypothetical protein
MPDRNRDQNNSGNQQGGNFDGADRDQNFDKSNFDRGSADKQGGTYDKQNDKNYDRDQQQGSGKDDRNRDIPGQNTR